MLNQAKAQQSFVEALELRESIEKMQSKLTPPAQVEKWFAPPSEHKTFAEMQKIIEREAGKQQVKNLQFFVKFLFDYKTTNILYKNLPFFGNT
jgi:hypothetical protein